MTQISEINEGVRDAVANVVSLRTPVNVLQETDYTIALALEFPKLMNQKKGFPNIKFGGCFIHPSPKANVHNTFKVAYQSCKVGDLLVLVRKNGHYNAALLRMRKSYTNPFIMKNSCDIAELRLYRQWPEFDLGITGPYNIYPKTVTQGALYCIIKPNPKRKTEAQFYLAEPMLQLAYDSQMTFARFIRDAINWQTGRSISVKEKSKTDEWSKLIWDLIDQTAKTYLYISDINYFSPSCLSDNFLHLLLEKQGIDMSVPTDGNNKGKNEFSGISILFIDIDEKYEEQDDHIE